MLLASPFSINVFCVTVLLCFMIYFLVKTQRRSKAGMALIVFLSSVNIVFLSFIFIFASTSPSLTTLLWWIVHTFIFGSAAMVQFAYRFPVNLHPEQSRRALMICVAAAALAYPYYILRTLSLTPQYNFEGNLFVYLNTPEIGIVIGLQIFWVIFVFFNKAVALSGYASSEHAAIWRKFFNPRDPRAGALRNLLILFFSPIILVSAIILAYLGYLSWAFVGHILGSGCMVVAFLFTVIYINCSPEPSTIMIKLVGISLGTVLIVLSFTSSFAVAVKDKAWDRQREADVRKYIHARHEKMPVLLPKQAAYCIAADKETQKTIIIAGQRDFVLPQGTTIPAPQSFGRTYRQFDPLDPARFFICYRITRDTRTYEIGYPYLDYRAFIQTTCLPLAVIVICASLFVLIIFPAFFRRSVFDPMDQLLSGVRQVNGGDLNIQVPVQVEDEIGFLSKSFNNMVVSINTAQTQLKDSLAFQLKLTDAYSRFVPREFLTFLNKKDITDISLGNHVEKEMTILFSDIRSFTALSEKMTPQENFNFINEYLSHVGPVVRKNNGFIDKYIGDAVMALFPHCPGDAIHSALGILKMIRLFNHHRQCRGESAIRSGIGIHTGTMMLGTIGEEKRMEGTVIADAVNLASRMEGLTKVYGSWIIVSRQTIDMLPRQDIYEIRCLDHVQVAGKIGQVEILEVIDPEISQTEAGKLTTRSKFHHAIDLYRQKSFASAKNLFQQIINANPEDKAAALYLQRCRNYEKSGVPENWEAIATFDKK